MVRVRLLVSRVTSNESQPFGTIVDVSEDEAKHLIDSNQAARVDPVKAPPEPTSDPIPEPRPWSPPQSKW